MSDVALETIAYQCLLEQVRSNPDHVELAEDLAKARCALELAWLEARFSQRCKPFSG